VTDSEGIPYEDLMAAVITIPVMRADDLGAVAEELEHLATHLRRSEDYRHVHLDADSPMHVIGGLGTPDGGLLPFVIETRPISALDDARFSEVNRRVSEDRGEQHL
jgi:hypothetical protein